MISILIMGYLLTIYILIIYILVKNHLYIKKNSKSKQVRIEPTIQYKKNKKNTIAEAKGIYGENKLYQVLNNLPGNKKIISNCYIKKFNNETTEIDIILIHRTGIYVFESKNYSGWIYGTENNDVWVQVINNGNYEQAYTFYNPILQNKGHIKWLKTYLSSFKNINYFSIIVFGNKCELTNFNIESKNTIVTKLEKTYTTIQNIINNEQICLTEESINNIYNILKQYTEINEFEKRKHIDNIKKYNH